MDTHGDAVDIIQRRRRLILVAVKSVHTVAFAVILSALLAVLLDGVRGRPSRRTGAATAIVLTECAVFATNGFVCPLTPLAERYGARRGSVTDIFLPEWLARNLTWISGSMFVVALGLNVRALARRRAPPSVGVERRQPLGLVVDLAPDPGR